MDDYEGVDYWHKNCIGPAPHNMRNLFLLKKRPVE